jgi:hypothetical protein
MQGNFGKADIKSAWKTMPGVGGTGVSQSTDHFGKVS